MIEAAEILRLAELGHGDRTIIKMLPSVSRYRVAQVLREARTEAKAKSKVLAAIAPGGLPAVSFYDAARHALAEAKTLSEVKSIGDKAVAMQEYARRLNDKTLERNAAEIRIQAKLALGDGLIAIKNTTGLDVGGRPLKTGPAAVPVLETLANIGITKNQSAEAQKLAKTIPQKERETRIAQWRENVEKIDRVTIDILKPGPSRSMNRVEAADSLDPFFTPPWATRALIEIVLHRLGIYRGETIIANAWEPACGEGHMAAVLEEYFDVVHATDIHDYGYGTPDYDFIHRRPDPPQEACDWIISNPPFKDGYVEKFILRALELAQVGVAMFCSLQTAEGVSRYENIFSKSPPTLIAFWSERVNCVKGKWDPDGSTDAAYIWLVWIKDHPPSPFGSYAMWIPPGQRKSLTRPGDRERFAAWSLPSKMEAAE